MTDAPERILTSSCGKLIVQDGMRSWPSDVEYLRADHALALVAEAYEVAAREADCGCVGRAAALDADTKTDRWRACGTDPCGAETAQFIRALTLSDTLAARDADRKRVRDEALREAAAAIKEHTDTAKKKMRMVYAAPVWSAIISHLDVGHDRILALIEGDQTDE